MDRQKKRFDDAMAIVDATIDILQKDIASLEQEILKDGQRLRTIDQIASSLSPSSAVDSQRLVAYSLSRDATMERMAQAREAVSRAALTVEQQRQTRENAVAPQIEIKEVYYRMPKGMPLVSRSAVLLVSGMLLGIPLAFMMEWWAVARSRGLS